MSDPYAAAAEKFDPMELNGQQNDPSKSGYKALQVMGSIKEKGFTDEESYSKQKISFPAVTVIPFPVARHRSEGPHWSPLPLHNEASETVELEDDELVNTAAAAAFAKPLIRKKRPELHFPKLQEVLSKSPKQKKTTPSIVEVTENSIFEVIENSEVERSSPGITVAPAATDNHSVTPVGGLINQIPATNGGKAPGDTENYLVPFVRDKVVYPVTPMVEPSSPRVSERESIDVENRQRILGMSQEEIEEAQTELRGKLNPRLLEVLKKRGARQETGAATCSSSDDPMEVDAPPAAGEAPNSVPAGTDETKSDSPSSAWTERVEAVKLMKFGLDGKLIHPVTESDGLAGFQTATERDFLRSGGDPAAWGYTIKQAAELSRSTVSGQRVLGLQLITSVLQNAANALMLDEAQEGGDWQAIWAYALGPHPEIAMALRLALDDSYAGVLSACAKAIQALLSCSQNDTYFKIRESTWPYQPLHYTAPVFRKHINQQEGFIGGGHWKYNVKPSEMSGRLAKENEESTVGTDAAVTERDLAAGLICMGILPRIRYLLEVEKLASIDEALLSILVAFAWHSPAAADAVMNCPRLIDAVFRRFFLAEESAAPQAQPARCKATQLLKVLSQALKSNCIYFAKLGVLQVTHGDLLQSFKGHSTAVEALKLWSVCIHHGLGVSFFSDFYPAISSWLLPPTQPQLLGNEATKSLVLAQECYKALELLARKLPVLRAQDQCAAQPQEQRWEWSMVVPLIESSTKWLQPWATDVVTEELQEESKVRRASLAGALGAVLHFLATVCERVLDGEPDRNWLPEFVPIIGLALVTSRLLVSTKDSSTLVRSLLDLKQTTYPGIVLPYANCLHATVRLGSALDRLLSRTRTVQPADGVLSSDERVLQSGLIRNGQDELGRLLSFIRNELIRSRDTLQVTEIKDRGGPAPGVGLGWGAAGGGFWSRQALLAEIYGRTALKLDSEIVGTTEDRVETCFSVATIADDQTMVAQAMSDVMFPESRWPSVLETAARTLKRLRKSETVTVPESDNLRLCLIDHYSRTWLRRKSKYKSKEKAEDEETLPTIHEDSEKQEEHELMVEVAGLRLPLPGHFFLSPLHYSNEDEAELVTAGLVLLLCVEGLPEGSPCASVSITRKIHALSCAFLADSVFLEPDVSYILRVLQDAYAHRLDTEGLALDFLGHVEAGYLLFAENLAMHFCLASFGDTVFGRQLGFYFQQQVPADLRVAVWRVLADGRALEHMPTLEQCPGPSEAYLCPVETELKVLELYAAAWITSVLDIAFSRQALPFQLALHHLGQFMFNGDNEHLDHRQKFATSIIRKSNRNEQAKAMFKELYNYLPGKSDAFLTSACYGNAGLLSRLKW